MEEPMKWDMFESKYFMPEPGRSERVILANPRMEYRTFRDSTTPKAHALFDVLRLREQQYRPGEKVVSTANRRLVGQLRRAFEYEGKNIILIDWWRDTNHNHTVILLNQDGTTKMRIEAMG